MDTSTETARLRVAVAALQEEVRRLRHIENAARNVANSHPRPKPYYGSPIWALDQALGEKGEVSVAPADGLAVVNERDQHAPVVDVVRLWAIVEAQDAYIRASIPMPEALALDRFRLIAAVGAERERANLG